MTLGLEVGTLDCGRVCPAMSMASVLHQGMTPAPEGRPADRPAGDY